MQNRWYGVGKYLSGSQLYTYIPADRRSIQFTPGGTASTTETTQDLDKELGVPDPESDSEGIEKGLELLKRAHYIEEQANHEEECEENIESSRRSWEEAGSGGGRGSLCESGNESDADQGELEGKEEIPEAGRN